MKNPKESQWIPVSGTQNGSASIEAAAAAAVAVENHSKQLLRASKQLAMARVNR